VPVSAVGWIGTPKGQFGGSGGKAVGARGRAWG
jgi:hypothetical protein